MNDVRGRAERLVRAPVRLADLALAFDESRAATAEVHVDGRGFFPPMLADIGTAASSIHINQFGFRPGTIGEAFATALLAKAAEGVHVRLVVDGQGSRPGRVGPRALRSSARRRRRRPRRARDAAARRAGRRGRPAALGCEPARPHRPSQARRRRRAHRVGRRRRDRGPLRRRPLPRPLREVDRPGGLAAAARVPRDLPLARGSDRAGRARRAAPRPRGRARLGAGDRAAQRAGALPADHDRDRRGARRRPRDARRGQPLCHRPPDDRPDRERRSPRGRGPPLRPRQGEQLALRGGTALPPRALLDAGVRILGHPAMLHAKAFVRDREDVLVGTCNLDAWSLKRFFEIDVLVRSRALAAQLDERFLAPAEAASTPGRAVTGALARARDGGVRSGLAVALTTRADGGLVARRDVQAALPGCAHPGWRPVRTIVSRPRSG